MIHSPLILCRTKNTKSRWAINPLIPLKTCMGPLAVLLHSNDSMISLTCYDVASSEVKHFIELVCHYAKLFGLRF